MDNTEVFCEIGRQWKEMTEGQKEEWKERAFNYDLENKKKEEEEKKGSHEDVKKAVAVPVIPATSVVKAVPQIIPATSVVVRSVPRIIPATSVVKAVPVAPRIIPATSVVVKSVPRIIPATSVAVKSVPITHTTSSSSTSS